MREALSNLTSSFAGQFTFGYDALSRRTSLNRPNTVNTSYTYDSVSRLLSVLHQLGTTTIDGASYGLDPSGNRVSKTNYIDGSNENYSYDAIYQLTQVLHNGSTSESYTYDGVGNRLNSLGVPSYTVNTSNELTSTSNATFTYDSDGNTTSKTDASGTTNYTWDVENRLVSVTLPGTGGTVTFKYDPFGRRIQKASPSGTINFAYDGANVVEELNTAGAATAQYAQGSGIDEPLATNRGGMLAFYEADGLGSVTSLTDGTGSALAAYTADGFGRPVSTADSTVNNPFRYTGREYDSETGLYYYQARYYDSAIGRFISEDPIDFQGGVNFYAYVGNDPVDWVDPFGLQSGKPKIKPPVFRPLPPAPGSPSFIAATAAGFRGSTYWRSWSWGGLDASVRPLSNKCNIFVGDVLSMNGIVLPQLHPKGKYPLAEDWANPKIPQIGPFSITTDPPQPGDVIAEGDHVGIVVGYHSTASASAFEGGTIVINDWGFRPGQHPTVRRCNSCEKLRSTR